MVCKKMYGGGMGDQIKRYCDEMDAEVIILINALMRNIYLIVSFLVIISVPCINHVSHVTGLSKIEGNRKTQKERNN